MIKNIDTKAIQLSIWTMSDDADHVFTSPSFQIQSNPTCGVYTNESHPEW